jgi:Trk K+ transport system NAD-binding subunit
MRFMAWQSEGGPPKPSREGPVVLCGLGRVGQGILALLQRMGERVAVVTLPAEAGAPVASNDDVRIIVGDARDEGILAQAGLDQAKALIAATDRDLDNVMIALHARQVAPDLPVVVRLFDENLADHLRNSLGLRHGYSASALAAPAFVAAALGDTVLTTFEAGGVTWAIEQYPVGRDSAWVGRTVGEFSASGSVVLGHERGTRFLPTPAASERLAEGDRLTLLARAGRCQPRSRRKGRLRTFGLALREWWKSTPRGLRFSFYALLGLAALSVGVFHWGMRLSLIDAYYFAITTFTTTGYGDFNLQNASPLLKLYGTLVMISGAALFAVLFSMATDLLLRTRLGDLLAQGLVHQRGHIIVAGLGHTGFRVVRELSRMGESVVAIENNPSAEFLSTARAWAPVITGSAGAPETLRRAGLAGARTLVAATDNDLTNLSAAMACKRVRRDCRVVARAFDQKLAGRVSGSLGIDAILSVTNATAPTFVGAALDADVLRGLILRDHLLLLAERAPDATARAEEQMLLVRTGGECCRPLEPGTWNTGDQVLAVRWIKLRT